MCGNVTVMGRIDGSERRAVPDAAWPLLERMLRISQMRGAQSGGGAIQVRQGAVPAQLIEKCLNTKRGDLARRMRASLERRAGSSAPFGATYIVQTHVRYATASVSTRNEAHPFRFVDVAARGPRRVARWEEGKLAVRVRPVETALTHNGDMDGMRWRGKALDFVELGCLFERILGVQNRWRGDSPVLAAAVELYLTRGLWLESLRLAYQLTVAPLPPDPRTLPAGLTSAERLRRLRELMAAHPAPSGPELSRWELAAEEATGELAARGPAPDPTDAAAYRKFREELAAAVQTRFERDFATWIPADRSLAFARAATYAFLDNDLYIALRKLEPALEGTFGCVITSTLEPGCLVAMARGQPLSLGFERQQGRVGVVSERAALKVVNDRGEPEFGERLDLDLCRGEIARVELPPEREAIRLTLYGISDGRELTSAELVAAGRLVSILNNPYVSALPTEAADRVEADFAALPSFLARVRNDFRDPASTNRRSAEVFADRFFEKRRPRVLVLGITNDLWLGQQFVQNLSLLFPEIDARALSSNEVLANPSAIHTDDETLVLAASQSGQDFPTLGALVLLYSRATPAAQNGFFVLTGEVDSLLGQAVGQSYAGDAPFCGRIFANGSGFRPSEATIATVNATHATFVEILLLLAARALDTKRHLQPPLGCKLGQAEQKALLTRRDATIDRQVTAIIGHAGAEAGGIASELRRQARRWSRHVSEGIVAFALVVLVLELNLQLGLGLLPSTLLSFVHTPESWPAWGTHAIGVLGAQANVLFYAFLAPLVILTLRSLQGRPGVHRQGTRELLIGDVRYVHQIGWLLTKKLFSLSYGFASIKPYSADCQDELVMTHEPLRGTLMLLGVPDQRRRHLAVRAGAALMAAKQFNNSRSFAGGGAEIITISHAPLATSGIGQELTLPTVELPELGATGDALVEGMFDSWERLIALQRFLDQLSRSVSRLGPFRYDRSRTKDQVFAPTTAAPVSAAAIYQLLSRSSERYERTEDVSLPFELGRTEWRASAPPRRTTVWRPEALLRELEEGRSEARPRRADGVNEHDTPAAKREDRESP
jgi:hypothetical protein